MNENLCVAVDERCSTFDGGRMHFKRKKNMAVQMAIEAVTGDIGGEHDGTCVVKDEVNGA